MLLIELSRPAVVNRYSVVDPSEDEHKLTAWKKKLGHVDSWRRNRGTTIVFFILFSAADMKRSYSSFCFPDFLLGFLRIFHFVLQHLVQITIYQLLHFVIFRIISLLEKKKKNEIKNCGTHLVRIMNLVK